MTGRRGGRDGREIGCEGERETGTEEIGWEVVRKEGGRERGNPSEAW